ncbi:hypothetical protein K9M59_02835 [Candidatus Gracilibacteria bacterium]|nr:hypothetical protein [Candidatus Gracilibacteria bacterium]MCF7819267.1 hypothetical protein [Candidatus Gracilibacteria bacterium]
MAQGQMSPGQKAALIIVGIIALLLAGWLVTSLLSSNDDEIRGGGAYVRFQIIENPETGNPYLDPVEGSTAKDFGSLKFRKSELTFEKVSKEITKVTARKGGILYVAEFLNPENYSIGQYFNRPVTYVLLSSQKVNQEPGVVTPRQENKITEW